MSARAPLTAASSNMASVSKPFPVISSVFSLAVIFLKCAVADYCQGYTDPYSGNYLQGFLCPRPFDDYEEYKCCGLSDNQYCCRLEDYNGFYGYFYWSAGKIVGVVIGALLACVLLIAIIIAIVYCYVKNLRKQQRRKQTNTISGSQTVSKTTTSYPLRTQDNRHQKLNHSRQDQVDAKTRVYEQARPGYPQELSYAPSNGRTQRQQPPGYIEGYPAQAFEYNSPQATYYSDGVTERTTYAPEVAPPPP